MLSSGCVRAVRPEHTSFESFVRYRRPGESHHNPGTLAVVLDQKPDEGEEGRVVEARLAEKDEKNALLANI